MSVRTFDSKIVTLRSQTSPKSNYIYYMILMNIWIYLLYILFKLDLGKTSCMLAWHMQRVMSTFFTCVSCYAMPNINYVVPYWCDKSISRVFNWSCCVGSTHFTSILYSIDKNILIFLSNYL